MIIDLTPSMTGVIANIGTRSMSARELGVNGCVTKRLWELGFLKMDHEADGYLPPYYSLSPKGEGAAAILNGKVTPVDREAPIARIKRHTAEHFGIPIEEMVSARRARKVARPRQVAMYLSKRLTPKSLPDIGRQFGHRDHTTVIHAIRTVERLMGEDRGLDRDVKSILGTLGTGDLVSVVDCGSNMPVPHDLVGA